MNDQTGRNGSVDLNATRESRLADLIHLAEKDPVAAFDRAISPKWLGRLAGMLAEAPGEIESFYRALQRAGTKARELEALRRTVRAEATRMQRFATETVRDRIRSGESVHHQTQVIFSNYVETELQAEGDKLVVVRSGLPVQQIAAHLLKRTGGFPKRVGGVLFAVEEDKPVLLESNAAVLSWISRQYPGEGINAVRWADGADKVAEGVFCAYLRQTAESYSAIEVFPHVPPRPGVYYVHPPLKGGDGEALAKFLDFFKPATLVDRDLIIATLLTLFWGGPAGARPAFVFTAANEPGETGRGAGKTKAAEKLADVVGGSIAASGRDGSDAFKTRLLSPSAMTIRVALLDNIKALRLSDAELEGLITCRTISGRQLYVGEGRRDNNLTWMLTVNGASFSKDLAQRSVVVQLTKPAYLPNWDSQVDEFLSRHRWEIIGDLIAILKSPGTPLAKHTRWGPWEDSVLSRVGDSSECQRTIAERQCAVDDDSAEADLVRDAFVTAIQSNGFDSADSVKVWIPAAVAATIVNGATGEKRPTNKATSFLETLGIAELRRSRGGDRGRGWFWCGRHVPVDIRVATLEIRQSY
jgi:hypothetical protein